MITKIISTVSEPVVHKTLLDAVKRASACRPSVAKKPLVINEGVQIKLW